MIKNVIKFVLLALFCAPMFAQTVTVTFTATDTDGQAWVDGNYSISLVLPAGSTSYHSTVTGLPFAATFQGGLDGTGSLSIALTPTNYIAPAGAQWQFKICPQVLNAGCGTLITPITASGSISSQINAVIPVPRITGGPGVYAYNDTEVSIFAPNEYFNVISQQNRCYSTSWGVCTGGGSSPFQSLTTTGNSGAATLIGGVLNIPNYVTGAGGETTQVQYNLAGVLTGNSGFTYSASTLTVPNLATPGEIALTSSGTQSVGFSTPSTGILCLDSTAHGDCGGDLVAGGFSGQFTILRGSTSGNITLSGGTTPATLTYIWPQSIPTASNQPIVCATTGTCSFSPVPTGLFTFTSATSDAFTVTGAASATACTFAPTNATAATNIATTYISSVATNTVTITHVTGAVGGTVNIQCPIT